MNIPTCYDSFNPVAKKKLNKHAQHAYNRQQRQVAQISSTLKAGKILWHKYTTEKDQADFENLTEEEQFLIKA